MEHHHILPCMWWLPERDHSQLVDWKRFRSFTRSLCLAPKKSRSDNTRQCSLGTHQGESAKCGISQQKCYRQL
jgi:hypothetical protein